MRRVLLAVALVAVCLAFSASASGALHEGSRATAVAPQPVRIAAVGDIACKNPPANNKHVCRYDDVSDLIAAGGYQAFLALGDNQYEAGSYPDYLQNYDAYFGRLLPITDPVPGNHEYGTAHAAGYFRYFGPIARGPDGWYSFELGGWHVIALNSAICSPYTGAACDAGTPEYDWLRADLASHPNSQYPCTLAYWHHPVWDWEKYQNNHWVQSYDYDRAKPFWKLLYRAGADVVLSGHNHNYQRYAPMDGAGLSDPAHGIREFIVGTGGRNLNNLGSPSTMPPTFITGQSSSFGALSMTLRAGSYDWSFQTAAGSPLYADAGTASCH
jgi:calcineurin-like phosphoesterase family protein